jgi:hypothetical protein
MPRSKPAIDPCSPAGRLTAARRRCLDAIAILASAEHVPAAAVLPEIHAAHDGLTALLGAAVHLPPRARSEAQRARDCLDLAARARWPRFLLGQAECALWRALRALADAAESDGCPCAACVERRQTEAEAAQAALAAGGTAP